MSRVAYVNGAYSAHGEAVVHIEDRGFQFADGVYEVWAVLGGKLAESMAESLRPLANGDGGGGGATGSALVPSGITTPTEASTSPAASPIDSSCPRRAGSGDSASAVPEASLTPGSLPSVMASPSGRPSPSTHDPCGVIPTATTSNRPGSRLRRMLPAETHEIACSELRPP